MKKTKKTILKIIEDSYKESVEEYRKDPTEYRLGKVGVLQNLLDKLNET